LPCFYDGIKQPHSARPGISRWGCIQTCLNACFTAVACALMAACPALQQQPCYGFSESNDFYAKMCNCCTLAFAQYRTNGIGCLGCGICCLAGRIGGGGTRGGVIRAVLSAACQVVAAPVGTAAGNTGAL
jgi:hypothetical protein